MNSPWYSEILICPFRYSMANNIFIQGFKGCVKTQSKAVHLVSFSSFRIHSEGLRMLGQFIFYPSEQSQPTGNLSAGFGP